jgi:deoxycytidine triphosphate deaminase
MIISPQKAIENGWVKGIYNPELQVQPNAIDFTLDRAYTVTDTAFSLALDSSGREQKQMRGGEELSPEKLSWVDYSTWTIPKRDMIDCLSDMYVEVPNDVAVMLVPRSTLTRNGLILASGLYDTGFQGHIGFLLHNLSSVDAYIGPGVRVGQCMFVAADSVGQYAGGWNHDQGTHTPNVN